jgi:hypothetical protein
MRRGRAFGVQLRKLSKAASDQSSGTTGGAERAFLTTALKMDFAVGPSSKQVPTDPPAPRTPLVAGFNQVLPASLRCPG